MKLLQLLFATAVSVALSLSSMAVAAEAEATAEEEPKIWKGSAEFGYVSTSGNSEESNMKGRFDAEREVEKWRFTTHFDALNSEANGDRSAEKYFIANRLAYKFNEYDYAFVYHSYDDDRFSGFDYQTSISAGYGRRILLPPPMTWDFEIGPGYRYSKLDDSEGNVAEGNDGDTVDELIVRLFTKYAWDFSDTSTFEQILNVEAGEEATISKSVTSLKVSIIGALAMKMSYTIKYTDHVPKGTKHADKETAVTLLYEF